MDESTQEVGHDHCTDPAAPISRRDFAKNTARFGFLAAVVLAAGGGKNIIKNAMSPDERPATRQEIEELLTHPGFRAGPPVEGDAPTEYDLDRRKAVETNDVDWFLGKKHITMPVSKPGQVEAACSILAQEWRCSYHASCCNVYAHGCRLWIYYNDPCSGWTPTNTCGSCSSCPCS